ncbi:MAG: PEP-CTERM sorting domain-containing protein [Verrucomicrobiales bacterium]|nr:PEP-CTERM sorting domain-containing protein [Verrucomicrobiales bacterium]
MNPKQLIITTMTVLGAGLSGVVANAQHGHLNAGAFGSTPGSQLTFANGLDFALSSGYVKDLTYATSGTYAGFYEGGITLTALAATTDNGGPVANAPALGSFIEARIVSVDGPAGGAFGFWEAGATAPTFSIGSGTRGGTFSFDLSDAELGAGQPGADPFGHLHGRRFIVTTEGNYTVGFKLFDVSANGPDFGPIHAASDTLTIQFRGVPEPGTLSLFAVGTVVIGMVAYRRRRMRTGYQVAKPCPQTSTSPQ